MISAGYAYYKEIFKSEEKPFAFVDLDMFDENIRQLKARAGDKLIRIASKSVRCPSLIKRALDADSQFQGIMAFSAHEAVFLYEQGFNDLLVAYPCWHENAIEAVCKAVNDGAIIYLMVDSPDHVKRLNKIAEKNSSILKLCVDLDMSSTFPGLHFGVHRSSINSPEGTKKLVKALRKSKFVELEGLMGYEAQIAGLGDAVPQQRLMNQMVRRLKNRSIKEIAKRRAETVQILLDKGFNLKLVNGGGTGSLESTRREEAVTEVTVGSGFFCSGLFDNYSNFEHYPSAAYAIEITRKPKEFIYTCAGGGYTASGVPGADKAPSPYLPEGIKLTANEGAGEVQTPIQYKGPLKLKLGDPIFLRHSKAGELCERFNQLLLVSKGQIIDRVPTYRGYGQCFL